MAAAKTTTDHDEIRGWVEARGGRPARVKRTGRSASDPGILRIDFPGFGGQETLEHIDWDDWFQAFEDNDLAFLYQDKVAGGRQSRFSKLVDRGAAPSRGGTRRVARGRAATARRVSPRSPAKSAKRKSTPRRGAAASKRTEGRGPMKRTTAKVAGRSTSKIAGTKRGARTETRSSRKSTRGGTKRKSPARARRDTARS